MYIEWNNIQMELRFRNNSDFIDFGNFEVVIIFLYFRYPLRFATGSRGAKDVSGHDHFGTRHFGTFSIRNIVTPGHVISGQARFGTAQQHYFKLLFTGSSHGPSANSAVIRYYSLLRVNDRLVLKKKSKPL